MTQDKIYLVGTLGLQKQEERFVKIMLGLTSHAQTSRSQGRYAWSEDLKKAEVVIVNSEDDLAMKSWHALSSHKPSPVLLLVTATEQSPYSK